MLNQPHLPKRGNVYQWRRRLRRQSTGIVDIKLSLGTTDLRCAHILSRRISAESDIVMEQLTHQQITSDMARRWLANVITKERAKIENLKLLHRFDSSDPADDNRHDQATADAWAQVNADGLHGAASEHPLVSLNLDNIRDDLTSEARQNIIQRDFKTLTGHPHLSAFDRSKLISLLIAGKAAAWNRHGDALADIDTSADDLWDSASQLLATETDPAVPSPQPAPAPEVDADTLDPDMLAVVSRMNEMKRGEGIEEKTLRQYESFVGLFTTLTGISDVRLIRQTDATGFRAALYKPPKSWGKSPADRNASRDEIMARAAKLPPDKVGLSIGTINRHLEHLAQIVEWASDEGIAVNPKLKPGNCAARIPFATAIRNRRSPRQSFAACSNLQFGPDQSPSITNPIPARKFTATASIGRLCWARSRARAVKRSQDWPLPILLSAMASLASASRIPSCGGSRTSRQNGSFRSTAV